MNLARQHKTPAREPGDLGGASPQMVRGRQGREGDEPHDDPAHSEESDTRVVPEKPGNKRAPDRGQLTLPGWFLAGDQEASADSVEGRRVANGKSARRNAVRTQSLGSRAHVTERIGRKAKAEKEVRFNNLLGHVRHPLLREAFDSLRKDAAAGVDGETWVHYEQDLEVRLADLEQRIHRGSYHPLPVRRVYIPKGQGKLRPIGIPALEDKIVQQAVRWLLEPIYETAFLGFSYGFRPGRSPHDALRALDQAIGRKLNWVLDADIRSFFDTIDHGWMQRFLEHRIADRRLVRLIMKWLHAGVLEDQQLRAVAAGTPQGGLISPLLSNIYLHYALDLWVHRWRRQPGHGEVYIVRYADDFVMGFQYERDARQLQRELTERLAGFHLELHPEKTRVLRFGRFAHGGCVRDGDRRPRTFDFLGFTHISARDRKGRFRTLLRTSFQRRKAKLARLREEIWRGRHAPVVEQHRRLNRVLQGHYNYYGVPGNIAALSAFRAELKACWHRALQRRSQRGSWNRAKRRNFDRTFPLLKPWITHRLNPQTNLPLTGGKSPVREIRSPGSVRGAR